MYPTWLVVQEHVPVEQNERQVNDEEASMEVQDIADKPPAKALSGPK